VGQYEEKFSVGGLLEKEIFGFSATNEENGPKEVAHSRESGERSVQEGKGSNDAKKKEDHCRVKVRKGWIKKQPRRRKLENGQVDSTYN